MRYPAPAVDPGHPPGAVTQVRAVLAMRAAGLRGPARVRVLAGLAAIPVMAAGSLLAGAALPAAGSENALLLLPTAWLGFAVTSSAGTASSGARTLLPRDQAAAFPFTPQADQLGAVLLAPLNVAWLIQAFGLLTLSAWSFGISSAALPAHVMTLTWIAVATVLAQGLGQLVELVRTSRTGIWVLRGAIVAALAALAAVALTRHLGRVLDAAPTRHFVVAAAVGTHGITGFYLLALAELGLLAGASWLLGIRVGALVARRPAPIQARVEGRDLAPRAEPRSMLIAALRVDRAGVWRSTPLRRGLVALTAIPALTVAAAGLEWPLIAVLPGLVASGAGLLFGVNALSLDGGGAAWRESLPGDPRLMLTVRLLVVAEVCVLGSGLAALIGAVRAPGAPTTTEIVAVLAAVVTTSSQVVARCATWSIRRPYAAALREARDQPAPPAAMAAYSTRLAFSTTATGMTLALLARAGLAWPVLAVAVGVTALAARRAALALRDWRDPELRGWVLSVVGG